MFASATAAAGDGGKICDFLKKSSLLHRIIDSECTKEAADGLKSKEQFSQLVIQYERLVYTICFQLVRSAPAAEDLTQETFLAAYLHRDTMPEGYERQWLGRIAANKAKDYLQSAWNRHTVLPGDEALPPGLAPPAEEEVLGRAGRRKSPTPSDGFPSPTGRCAACVCWRSGPWRRRPWHWADLSKPFIRSCAGEKPSCASSWKGVKAMKLFRDDGHLTDEALTALAGESLDDLSRLEIAEHLAFCDLCLQRYTLALEPQPLLTPSRSCRESLMRRIRERTLHLITSRYATAAGCRGFGADGGMGQRIADPAGGPNP